jgi:predicted nucleic acid-binding protein
MMRAVFADTDYWVALLHRPEQLHERAEQVSSSLGHIRIITSEMVLVEVLSILGSRGRAIREGACEAVQRLRQNPNVAVVPQTSAQFMEAFESFRGHKDKGWSLTDCASFLIMREAGLAEALTHDHHFEQAGFRALLRG